MKNLTEDTIKGIFVKHYQEWCVLSFTFLHNMPEAEDVVQDVMVKLLTKKDLHTIENLPSYIKVSIRNASLLKLKSGQKVRRLDETIYLYDTSYEQELIEKEGKLKVQNALNILPEQSKRVFELCVIEGLQYKNTADVLGISTNTVKYHLKKAFKILRHNLSGSYFFSLFVVITTFFC
ncbi:MAG: sigma-70 family RNA polymerase sigma factor [Allomuricauda sp.]|jgi:RNA polymerase sigma-70 factor (ECF subfamily)|uniref:sigma-70 family RNA polymerase sigma factor n=1 Tax=Allomuricauda sp. CP2A TaxID=1848189 RepID=UPI0009F59402|nr:sigma-70 family RNA polymerase sigma factor [Muricauda sp. CP2A]